MWSLLVVMSSPGVDLGAGVLQRFEPMLIQAALAVPTVEALDERVLHWLAGLDEVQFHSVVRGPEEHCLAGQFRAVVANDGLR